MIEKEWFTYIIIKHTSFFVEDVDKYQMKIIHLWFYNRSVGEWISQV